MSTLSIVVQLIIMTVALWLGGFLLARDAGRPSLRNGGAGTLVFGLALAGLLLSSVASQSGQREMAALLGRLAQPMLFLPALLWAGTLIHLLPEETPYYHAIARGWAYGLPVLVTGFLLLGAGTDWIFTEEGAPTGIGFWIAGGVALSPLLELLILLGLGAGWPGQGSRKGRRWPARLIGIGLLFFTLSATLLLLPQSGLPRIALLLGMGLDLVLLGIGGTALDAENRGEAWLPELLRSSLGTLAGLLLFAAPVALTMRLGTGITFAMTGLLVGLIGATVFSQTLGSMLGGALDTLAYAPFPRLRESQSDLRTEAQSQVRFAPEAQPPKVDEASLLDPMRMKPKAFGKLTRRALSHYGNLPKLAQSPLIHLALVYQRLAEKDESPETLAQAGALKEILAESIERLRPPVGQEGEFNSSDEWRHFNALYYPYVVGLRPYSRRAVHDDLTPDEAAALEWFRTLVPERTLYNWQSAAAELVAQDLRERTL